MRLFRRKSDRAAAAVPCLVSLGPIQHSESAPMALFSTVASTAAFSSSSASSSSQPQQQQQQNIRKSNNEEPISSLVVVPMVLSQDPTLNPNSLPTTTHTGRPNHLHLKGSNNNQTAESSPKTPIKKVVHNGQMYIFGGWNGNYLNDLFFYDPERLEWKKLTPNGMAPLPRCSPECAALND